MNLPSVVEQQRNKDTRFLVVELTAHCAAHVSSAASFPA